MPALKHVLIAIDFGEATEPLLECAGDLESLGAERFTLLHVEPVGYPAASRVTHREAYEARLREAAGKLGGKGVSVETALRSGSPGSEIAAAPEELRADLIVLAAHDHGTLRRGLIGSVASDALHHASVPVLLQRFTREEAASPEVCGLRCGAILRRPLLATDGSSSARNAEEMTVALSRGAERTILLTVTEGDDGQGAHADLESLARRCSGDVRFRVEEGKKASEVIRRVIEEEDATLLLVGRKGRGVLQDRLLGSTAENATRESLVPTLVLP